MRIIKYTTKLDENKLNVLVKEKVCNYPGIKELNSPQKIVTMMEMIYDAIHLPEEYLWMLALDTKCKMIGIFEISHGTVDSSIISPREIFIKACLCGAVNIVLVHNHPSGTSTPSTFDIEATKRILQCGELMNISLLDHIIIGEEYFSFKEYGFSNL